MPNFSHTYLIDIAVKAFQKAGVSKTDSLIMANSLVDANLSGYDSHGIIKIPFYVKMIKEKEVCLDSKIEILKESPSSLYIDCKLGLGPVTAIEVLNLSAKKAKENGISVVSCINSTYLSRLGGFVENIANKGLICILMANDAGGYPATAPYGSFAPFFSTNPIAAGIPRTNSNPIIIDIATSIAAIGKLRILSNKNEKAPNGWLINQDGKPEQNPKTFFESPMASALLPIGGLLGGHKGFALSLLVDILAGGLSGAGCSTGEQKHSDTSGFFALVINPEFFISNEKLEIIIDELINNIKESKKNPEFDEILIPGERSTLEKEKRKLNGINVDEVTWGKIEKTLKDLGITS